jgi:hypothetical protein
MIITSHQQLCANRKALQTLIDEGMTTSEDYMQRVNARIEIKFDRCVSLKYTTLRKEAFFDCIDQLQKDGLLTLQKRSDRSYRAEIATNLPDYELHHYFDPFSEGTLCIAERSIPC